MAPYQPFGGWKVPMLRHRRQRKGTTGGKKLNEVHSDLGQGFKKSSRMETLRLDSTDVCTCTVMYSVHRTPYRGHHTPSIDRVAGESLQTEIGSKRHTVEAFSALWSPFWTKEDGSLVARRLRANERVHWLVGRFFASTEGGRASPIHSRELSRAGASWGRPFLRRANSAGVTCFCFFLPRCESSSIDKSVGACSKVIYPPKQRHRQHGHTTVDGCQAAGLPGSIEVSLPAPLKTPDFSGTDNFNSSELRRGEKQEAEGRSSTHARHENPTLMESCSTIWHHID
ncbi:uncharacterized protein CIMG_13388 [Coccidioides immitis RS]|uniref:Uncharacterized protein n=1 Tax=Coccidioides immitis (strain RS) TaxID=246410 RepID=A0A0D8JXN9_COCIM|nr:uncharacterized protein CIMG_13388 [Coccidioides immitis RS]KJF61043.1 hypothetical protein CIMG_13388 [Coccidioides immitis RS]